MLNNYIKINYCNHYVVNTLSQNKIFFVSSDLFIENDCDTIHPIGAVFKPKGVIDTPIRFVVQPDTSILLFNLNEWRNNNNSFIIPKFNLLREIKEAFYDFISKKYNSPIIKVVAYKGKKKYPIAYPSNW